MPDETDLTVQTSIRVRYWAAARAAAGVRTEVAGPLSLTAVRERVVGLHPDTRLSTVLAACSALVGERPVGTADPAGVLVAPGATVEFLPPFAGG